MGWQYVTTFGLVLDIIGVVLLFKFGLPPSVNRHGHNFTTLGGQDEDEIKTGKLYDRISWGALALLVIGFGLQIAGNHPAWFGIIAA